LLLAKAQHRAMAYKQQVILRNLVQRFGLRSYQKKKSNMTEVMTPPYSDMIIVYLAVLGSHLLLCMHRLN
jgi:hypothetical protein